MLLSFPRFLSIVPIAIAAGVCCAPQPALAQASPAAGPPTAASGDTIRLSDAQRDMILDGNTVESAARARGEMADAGEARPAIHGEIGAMIGSNGTRGVYGTAAVPLGDNAGAVVSFESSRYGYRR